MRKIFGQNFHTKNFIGVKNFVLTSYYSESVPRTSGRQNMGGENVGHYGGKIQKQAARLTWLLLAPELGSPLVILPVAYSGLLPDKHSWRFYHSTA